MALASIELLTLEYKTDSFILTYAIAPVLTLSEELCPNLMVNNNPFRPSCR